MPQPTLDPIPAARFELQGEIADRLDAVTLQWILPTPRANPAILEMFRNRDRKPLQELLPWSGEFAGKYLTHMVQIHRLTRSPQLREHIAWFVRELVVLQDKDGYLGPWSRAWRMKKGGPVCAEPWDAWGHYHIMLGLLLHHADSGDESALGCARRIGDYFCDRFLNKKEKLHDTGAHEMNQAPIHSLAMLYRVTSEKKYLAMAEQIEREFALPPAGDYLRAPLAGKKFYETPKPRWESLHPIMGLSELYLIKGDAKRRRAFESLWWSMVEGDRHNNGGFSSGEQATGNPYDDRPIETCCTIAWMAMSVEMLRLTGNSIVADEIELSLLNSGLGMMSPSGRWVTYNTPMHGFKRASAHDIVFQARPGSPELNCCSVNGPRALGMICEWAVMKRGDREIALNYYGAGAITAPLSSESNVILEQKTDYPRSPRVEIGVSLQREERFTLLLRIPHWSRATRVKVNGKTIKSVKAGSYLKLARDWRHGDRIVIDFDFSPRFWVRPDRPNVDWETKWTLFGVAPATVAELGDTRKCPTIKISPEVGSLTAIPRSLDINGKSCRGVQVKSKAGIVAGKMVDGTQQPRGSMVAITVVNCDRPREMTVAFGADWWSAWYLNGAKVFDNMYDPNGNSHDLDRRNHKVVMRLKRGRNVIALVIGGGSKRGAWATFGVESTSDTDGAGVRQASIYRGPLLLAFDPRFNTMNAKEAPVMKASALKVMKFSEFENWLKPWMLGKVRAEKGGEVALCDFASAGVAGNEYRTWLPVRFAKSPVTKFARTNPSRTFSA